MEESVVEMSNAFRQALLSVHANPVYYSQQLPHPILVFSRFVRFWLLMKLVKTDTKILGLRRT